MNAPRTLRAHLTAIADAAAVPVGLADRARTTARAARVRTGIVVGAVVIALAGGVAVGLHAATRSTTDQTGAPLPASVEGGGPGTALVDGIKSPAGTVVLGAVFPMAGGHQAVLQVTGDPYQVLRDLRDQVMRAGYRLDPSTEPCTADSETVGRSKVASMDCTITGQTPDSNGTTMVFISMIVSTGPGPYAANVVIQMQTAATNRAFPAPAAGSMVTIPDGRAPFQPGPVPGVPAVGERINDPYGHLGEQYQVAAGSRMLIPTFRIGCLTGGFYAVVRADAPVTQVVDDYVHQFEAARLEVTSLGIAGYTTLSEAGGGDASVATATATSGTHYVLLSRCND